MNYDPGVGQTFVDGITSLQKDMYHEASAYIVFDRDMCNAFSDMIIIMSLNHKTITIYTVNTPENYKKCEYLEDDSGISSPCS